jgi:hypothetical protein
LNAPASLAGESSAKSPLSVAKPAVTSAKPAVTSAKPAVTSPKPAVTSSRAAPVVQTGRDQGKSNGPIIRDVLVVRQKNKIFNNSELYLSDNACRYLGRDGDLIIASKAPDWDIVVYSKARNSAMRMKPQEAQKNKFSFLQGVIHLDEGVKKAGDGLFFGSKYFEIYCKPKESRKVADAFVFQNRNKKEIVDTTYRFGEFCKITPHVHDFLGWIYATFRIDAVPLELKNRYKDGSVETVYSTSSVEHTSKPASFFAYPTGYKVEHELTAVMLQPGYEETLEDFFGTPDKAGK